jgi:hypothetical protein
MTPKRLEQESVFNVLDEDGDGILSDEEIMKAEKLAEIEAARAKEKDRDAKEDQLRQMAWVAMLSMLGFTVLLFLPFIDTDRVTALDNLLQMFYIAQAGVVATFFGSSAYMNRNM